MVVIMQSGLGIKILSRKAQVVFERNTVAVGVLINRYVAKGFIQPLPDGISCLTGDFSGRAQMIGMHIVNCCAFQHGDGLAKQVNGFLNSLPSGVVFAD